MNIDWRCGFEVELLAPRGRTRADLAHAVAQSVGGRVRRGLHADSEPSLVPDKPVFQNLTLAFEAVDATGARLVRCVDDLTLQADLNRAAPPRPGWWRVVTDDERLVRILARFIDAERDLPDALAPLEVALGATVDEAGEGILRIRDVMSAPLGLVAPLPGERERPCEVVTSPLERAHLDTLENLLAQARALDFTVPVEGALHVHFDAARLCDARVLRRLVTVLTHRAVQLRALVGTPSTFRRVGGLSAAVLQCVLDPDFAELDWPAARARLAAAEPSKYCDYNLRNIAHTLLDRHTFEVRIMPATLDALEVVAAAALFEGLIRRSLDGPLPPRRAPAPWSLQSVLRLLDELPLETEVRAYWRARARQVERR